MSRIVPLPTTNTVVDNTVAIINADGSVASFAGPATTVSRIPSSENTTNATSAKASAGKLFSVNGYNSSATVTYLKFYDKATAPTVGTDTPVLTYALPATAAFSFPVPFGFATGIGYGLVTGAADNNNTAVGAGDVLGLSIVWAA